MNFADSVHIARNLRVKRVIYLIITLALLFAGTFSGTVLAETVDGHVFLQGTYIEVGVNNAGFFGAPSVPAGYHPTESSLGFVADYQKDGWDAGTPLYGGDYFTPGSPYEGFGVEWDASSVETSLTNHGDGLVQIPTISHNETSSGDTLSSVWVGEAVNGSQKLKIIQTASFKTADLFFTVNVQLINTGSVMLESVEYERGVDPDNEQPWTSSYDTLNEVVYQPGVDGNVDKALVTAKGPTYTDMTLGLGTFDSRARASANTHGFNINTDNVLDSPVSGPLTGDNAIGLAFRFGDLAPGQSVSFDYAYILSEDDLEAALGSLAAVTILQPTGTVSGTSVPFQVTTEDVPSTTKVDFYINGSLIGTDTTPSADIFELTFNSTLYPNGTINLKAVATFNDASTAEKTATVDVDNSGPPMSFIMPTPGQLVSGDDIPIRISVDDALNPPVSVTFYREAGATVNLGTDNSAPFEATFDTSDLALGTPITLRAIGVNAGGESTNITVGVLKSSTAAPTGFTAADPPDGIFGTAYSYTFVADGTPAPSYTLQSGTLPPGLSLNPTTGELSGTPTAPGNFTGIVIRAENTEGFVDTSPLDITIGKAGSMTTLDGFVPAAVVAGQPYTVTVTVDPVAPVTITPTGTVDVSNGTDSCTVTLSDATGTCNLTPTFVGQPDLSASYPGDDDFNASTANPLAGPEVTKADTTTTVSATSATIVFGDPVSFNAAVSVDAPGSGIPTGKIQFYLDGGAFGAPADLVAGEAASQEVNDLGIGVHTVYAEYLGDDNYIASTSADWTQTVVNGVIYYYFPVAGFTTP